MRRGWNWLSLLLLSVGAVGCTPESAYKAGRVIFAPSPGWLVLLVGLVGILGGSVGVFATFKSARESWRERSWGFTAAFAVLGLVILGVTGAMGYLMYVFLNG